MKFAGIDIGSNGVRLLISLIVHNAKGHLGLSKLALYRVPLRLGEDVFKGGRISPAKQDDLIKTMLAFRYLAEVQRPLAMLACGTSALREAENRDEVLAAVKEKSGVEISLITGHQEAELICQNRFFEELGTGTFLFIDVGGGSTELTVFDRERIVAAESFRVGTLRLLSYGWDEREVIRMKEWLRKGLEGIRIPCGVGTGGNINFLYKLAGKPKNLKLSYKQISQYYQDFKQISIDERMERFEMKPDRADVIIPALEIYLRVMEWARIGDLLVPKRGLSDGIIYHLYEQYEQGRQTAIRA